MTFEPPARLRKLVSHDLATEPFTLARRTQSLRFYADLHIHSKHSYATSPRSDLLHLAEWAARKGILVLGTGDFTHPAWFEELSRELVPAEPGLFRLRDATEREVQARLPRACRTRVRFMLQVEISTIYRHEAKVRKVHHLVYVPDFESAARFRARLARHGNLASDGRPILGMDSRDLLECVLQSHPDAYLIPAHVWTPWFAVLGSRSGFDAVDACYRDLAPQVFAIETGLSSDPPLNRRVSSLDRYTLVSNSDAHSPQMIGREACVFECSLDYFAMRRALRTRKAYGGTVEFFPEEGKYHLDGHRKCAVRLTPNETHAHHALCPECGKPLTLGVLHRIEALCDRELGASFADPFVSLLALPEVLSELSGVGPKSARVSRCQQSVSQSLGPELPLALEMPLEEVRRAPIEGTDPELLALAIERMREGRVRIDPGFDGVYGTVRLFDDSEQSMLQKSRKAHKTSRSHRKSDASFTPELPPPTDTTVA